jgi:hypothetical protein
VIKNLTILPKRVIPRIMPITIARKTARTRVNLKTRKKRGNKTTQSIIVRQPVAKSLVSNMGILLPVFPFQRESNMDYNRSKLMKEGMTGGLLKRCILILELTVDTRVNATCATKIPK